MAISKELLSDVKSQKHRLTSLTNSYVMSDIDDLLVKNIDMLVYVACRTVTKTSPYLSRSAELNYAQTQTVGTFKEQS
mgnify:CR=1 FL=1